MKSNYIADAWLVIVLGLVFGGGLASVQLALRERIEFNKTADILSQVSALVKGADRQRTSPPETMEVASGDGRKTAYQVYRACDSGGHQVGWVVRASGQGFADVVEVLIGLDLPARTLTGLYVLDQKETPGLGARVTEEKWRGQFRGKPAAGPLTVTKGAPGTDQIQAITGATISSQSVTDIVNRATGDLKDRLAAGAKE